MLECELVENIVIALWRLKRAARVEAEILDHFSQPEGGGPNEVPFEIVIRKTYTGSPQEIDEPQERPEPRREPEPRPRKSLGEAVKAALEGTGVLSKFIRYEAHISKTLYASIRELERVQERRRRQNVIHRDIQDTQDCLTTKDTKNTKEMHEYSQDTQDDATPTGRDCVARSSGTESTENQCIHRDSQATQDFATEGAEDTENHRIHRDVELQSSGGAEKQTNSG